jgi:ribosomal protein S18 acetylase RimI-like enzyme
LIRNMAIQIRSMEKADVPALVRLHAEVFEGYNSTAMGAAYLKRLYRELAGNPSCLSVVALEDDVVVGWIGGVKNYPSYNRALVRNCALAAPSILFSILKNRPALLARAVSFAWHVLLGPIPLPRRRKRAGKSSGPATAPRHAANAHWLVLGVDANHRRRGLSQLMGADFHRRLVREGFKTCTASTYADNEPIDKFLKKASYKLLDTTAGVNHYIKYLVGEGEMKP